MENLLRVKEVTPDEVAQNDRRSYNPSVWENTIKRYAKYEGCKFYQSLENKGTFKRYSFFAVYNIKQLDGTYLRFLKEVNYSSSLSSNSFGIVVITEEGFMRPTKARFMNSEAQRRTLGVIQQIYEASGSTNLCFTNEF